MAPVTSFLMPPRCPGGHDWTPGSFVLFQELCYCRAAVSNRGGHHLLVCLVCQGAGRWAMYKFPECEYLGM
jgi:hypothetical protein